MRVGITGLIMMSAIVNAGDFHDLLIFPLDEWQPSNKIFIISSQGGFENTEVLPSRFLHGPGWTSNPDMNTDPLEFELEFLSDGEFVFMVDQVSVEAELIVSIDGDEQSRTELSAGPGDGPWLSARYLEEYDIYQSVYHQEFRIPVQKGKRRIRLENSRGDWVSFDYFVFTNVGFDTLSPEYEKWLEYRHTVGELPQRLEEYERKVRRWAETLTSDNGNYDVLPTLELQFRLLSELTNSNRPFHFDLMRTEFELKDIFKCLESGKPYFSGKPGRVKRAYRSQIDGSLQPYDIMLPNGIEPDQLYGLWVNLHGYEVDIRKYGNLLWADDDPSLDDLKLIRAAVYGRRNRYYLGAGEQDVMDVIQHIIDHYPIDENRVFLAGASMGGYGTWKLGLLFPDRFAAISPACGPTDLNMLDSFHYPGCAHGTLMKSLSPIEFAVNARGLPSRIYHGAVDPTVSVQHSRKMTEELTRLDCDHVYIEYPDVGHSVWNQADQDSDRMYLVKEHFRRQWPADVEHRTFYLRYGKAFWTEITGKQDWEAFARIKAGADGNRIRVITENVSDFTLDTRGFHFNPHLPVVFEIDGTAAVEIKAAQAIPEKPSFYRLGENWMAGLRDSGRLQKRSGLEGPWMDGEKSAAVIVVGSVEHPSRQTEGFLRNLKEYYAEYDIEFPVISSEEFLQRQDYYAANMNIHIIGFPDENPAMKMLLKKLPVETEPELVFQGTSYSPETTGVRMIYPNPQFQVRYVLLDILPENRRVPPKINHYLFPDYLIYKSSGEDFKVLKEGFFDTFWR